MRKIYILILLCLGLVGCVYSSGVIRTGQDTYIIARTQERLDGSSNNVKAAAIKVANKYCERCGKVIKVISTSQKDMVPFKSDATAEIQFMCLDANDPRLKTGEVLTTQQSTQGIKTGGDSLEIKLKTLNKLLSGGLITQKDFEEQKLKLLNEYTVKK